MTEITMPLLSDAMEEGTILAWLIEDGQPVSIGDEFVEIETDKATMTHSAEAEGVLEIVAREGEVVPVGQVIARLIEPGTSPATERTTEPAAADEEGAVQLPADELDLVEPAAGAATAPPDAQQVPATPLAKRMAAAHSLALESVTGTGPRGRVTKADVLTAVGVSPVAGAMLAIPAVPQSQPKGVSSGPATPSAAKGGARIEELTKLQAVVARRMAEAKATVPDFQVETEATMDAALALRSDLKELPGDRPAPSLNDMVVKACALALIDCPKANGSYADARFELHERINVGIAVAAEGSLVVPTITDADTRALFSIAAEAKRLAARVRSGEITPPELAGGTFTVSNLGMYGMTAITPVINLPQAAILGVGALRQVLARNSDGAIVDRTLLTLRLTCDHRILYGADAAEFLADIKSRLEQPLTLLA